MSKMAELQSELTDLKECGERIVDIANYLLQAFSGSESKKKTKPATKPTPTLEEIRFAMKILSGKGYADEMKDILSKHGSNNLTNLAAEEYEGVMNDLEVFANAT